MAHAEGNDQDAKMALERADVVMRRRSIVRVGFLRAATIDRLSSRSLR